MHIPRVGLVLALMVAPGLARAALSADEQKIMAAVDANVANFPHDLEAAVQINSATESHAGVTKLGKLFQDQLAAAGLDAKFVDLSASTGRAGHLIAEHRGTKGKRVLLIGHLDTVLPGGNYKREGDRALGSGTSDIKGGDLIIIYALRALHDAGMLADTQISVVMTGDEEAVGKPLEISRRDLLEIAHRSDVVLSFESAIANTGTIARRGTMSWEVEVQGATGHSSGIFSSSMGAGSVYEAARILSGFYAEMRQFDGLTLNPGLIVGGTEVDLDRTHGTAAGKTNITAQRTLIHGDLRTMSAEQLKASMEKMREIVAKHLPRTSATITFSEGYPAMPETPENHTVLAQLDEASRDLGYGPITAFDPKARGAGDVAFVSPPLAGLDGMGIRGGGAHAPNEWADLATVPEMVKRTALMIYRYTHGSK